MSASRSHVTANLKNVITEQSSSLNFSERGTSLYNNLFMLLVTPMITALITQPDWAELWVKLFLTLLTH